MVGDHRHLSDEGTLAEFNPADQKRGGVNQIIRGRLILHQLHVAPKHSPEGIVFGHRNGKSLAKGAERIGILGTLFLIGQEIDDVDVAIDDEGIISDLSAEDFNFAVG